MPHKQNLHVHSTYCDGKDTPREIVEAAITKGFTSIGFSGHSYMSYAQNHSMSIEGTREYIKEVNSLKKEYNEKINIFCGIEYDMYSDISIDEFDYSIGSVHYFKFGNEYVGFDRSAKVVEGIIDTYFNGDGMKYAKKYYENVAELYGYGRFDIIGHFDLITKHSESTCFFDENSKQYLSYAFDALRALRGKIPFFEINTGAISRGYRTTPYPSIPLIKEMKRLGFGAVITSDCHNAQHLDCYYRNAAELLKSCGFSEKYILTENGFEPDSL